MISIIFLFTLLAIGPIFTSCQNNPIVTTPLGSIQGIVQTSRKGIEFLSFRGIRYAEPPIGGNRFQPPIPVQPWEGIYDATQDGPVCIQPNFEWETQSEDCLRLNVYTRQADHSEYARPVIVFIHGGAFVNYAGTSNYYGPDFLLDHDIVLVTINYRLGTLGFLSTGDEYAPGNYGMKDQVEALKWVQKNIKYFGGDLNRVIIAGESAGSGSVSLHLVSPMSKGLFHGAIALSGTAINSWVILKDPLSVARTVANILSCPTENSRNMIDCLRTLPAEEFTVYTELMGWRDNPLIVISPVIETTGQETEKFLAKDFLQAMIDGDGANVPVFLGTTGDELLFQALPVVTDKDWAEDLSANWTSAAPIAFLYEQNDTISQSIRQFYFGNTDEPFTNKSFERLGQIFSDSYLTYGVIQAASLISAKNTAPVYLYQFNYIGKTSGAFFPGDNKRSSASHGDDLLYLFNFNTPTLPQLNATGEDGACVDRFTTLWKNFAETGNPTPEPEEILNNAIWEPFTKENPSYMDLNRNLTLVKGIYYEERVSFWENLFPINY